jgi:hypothetical protein
MMIQDGENAKINLLKAMKLDPYTHLINELLQQLNNSSPKLNH